MAICMFNTNFSWGHKNNPTQEYVQSWDNSRIILFTVLIQKSDKQWKVLSGCLKNLPTGIPWGHQSFTPGCTPRESLMTLGNSLGQIFPDNHYGLSTVCTRVGY